MGNGAAGTILLLYSTSVHPKGEHCASPVSAPQSGCAGGKETEKGS